MKQIEPSLTGQDIVCVETKAPGCALIVFGASGDLAKRKLLISLFNLFDRELLSDNFYLLGYGRKELSDDDFRQVALEAITEAPDAVRSKA